MLLIKESRVNVADEGRMIGSKRFSNGTHTNGTHTTDAAIPEAIAKRFAFPPPAEVTPSENAVHVYTTQGPPHAHCGYFNVNGYNDAGGSFLASVSVFFAQPKNGDPSHEDYIPSAEIKVNTAFTEVFVKSADGHPEFTVTLPGMRATRDQLLSKDDTNFLYQIARAVTENHGKGEAELRKYLEEISEGMKKANDHATRVAEDRAAREGRSEFFIG